MVKLTKVQKKVLSQAALNDGRFTAWVLGTRTCEALRKRGLLAGERPFQAGWRDNGYVWITDAGRAALNEERR